MRIEPVSPGNDRATVGFLTGWVTDGPADAWEYLASHTGGEGASVVTVRAGPAQRLSAKLGYLPDGRGACHGREPVPHGTQVTLDDDIILWLTKDLARR